MDLLSVADGPRQIARLSFDPKARFPAKLYDVANDGFLVKWSASGTSIFVDEDVFEKRVVKTYPGFVQIASFLNFRRLFREYSFDWKVVEGTDTLFEFSHPAFIRDRDDLLDEITTKRKSLRRHCSRRQYPFTYLDIRCSKSKRGYRRRRLGTEGRSNYVDNISGNSSSAETTESGFILTPAKPASHSDVDLCCTLPHREDRLQEAVDLDLEPNLQLYSSTRVLNAISGLTEEASSRTGVERPTQHDLLDILAIFAMNELTEEECLQLVASTAASDLCLVPSAATTTREDARKSVSSQSLPSLDLPSPEFVPSDVSLQNVTWEGWGLFDEKSSAQLSENCKQAPCVGAEQADLWELVQNYIPVMSIN